MTRAVKEAMEVAQHAIDTRGTATAKVTGYAWMYIDAIELRDGTPYARCSQRPTMYEDDPYSPAPGDWFRASDFDGFPHELK